MIILRKIKYILSLFVMTDNINKDRCTNCSLLPTHNKKEKSILCDALKKLCQNIIYMYC